VAKRGPAGRDGDEPRDADPGAAGDDRVTAAADELYSADPAEFTDRRKALADAARAAGDAAAAKRIAALRKPTRAAWVVNRLARADPAAPDRLADLAAALRAAEEAKDGRRLRELSAARGPLVDSLTAQDEFRDLHACGPD
jgi:Lon protease-like protein